MSREALESEGQQANSGNEESTLPSSISQENFDKILCPILRIGVRAGLLDPDQDGWVASKKVRNLLDYVGIKPKSGVAKLLIMLGESTTKEKRSNAIHLTAFKGTFLDHGSESCILNNPSGFSQERLDYLKSFSSDGERLTEKDLAKAANAFNDHPVIKARFIGNRIETLELASILELLGRTDNNGKKYFLLKDVDSIWKHSEFPEGWTRPKKPFYTTLKTITDTIKLRVKQL